MIATIDRRVRHVGRRLVESYPRTERPLLYARSLYAVAYLRAVKLKSAAVHDAPIDPFRLHHVDPAAVERAAEDFNDPPRYRRVGRVIGGDWDRDRERFDERTLYQSFRAHFEDGVPWPETDFFRTIVDRIEDGEVWWGCRSRSEFERRCERLDDLYEDVAENGVLSQAELARQRVDEPIEKSRPTTVARSIEDEITVNVGRDGEFFFADGRNRLAIAKLLDVDTVPVRIMVRHERWQSFRDGVAAGRTSPGDHVDHPDVRPLLD